MCSASTWEWVKWLITPIIAVRSKSSWASTVVLPVRFIAETLRARVHMGGSCTERFGGDTLATDEAEALTITMLTLRRIRMTRTGDESSQNGYGLDKSQSGDK